MGKKRLFGTGSRLRQVILSTKNRITSDSLFIGTACCVALVSYTHYVPTLAHTTPAALSFSDMACFFGVLTSIVLLVLSRHNHSVFARPLVIWTLSVCVLASILLLALLPGLAYPPFDFFTLIGGALFGVYLSVVAVCWLWVYAHNSAATVIWNIMCSALAGAVILWFVTGMDTPRVACSLFMLLGVSAYTLTKRMRLLSGSSLGETSPESGRHTPVFIIVATLLFSYTFMVSLSFAGLEHFSSAFSTIAILIPFLLLSIFMLSFKRLTTVSLLNVAVPIIVTATLSVSFLHINPVVTFDLALVGILLFLAYVVVLLCAITEKTDIHAYRAFSLLMIAYFGGCIIGRGVSALALFSSIVSHEIVVASSVLAALMAMLLCIRNGFIPRQFVDLLNPDRLSVKNSLIDSQAIRLSRISEQCSLGSREREVLELLLQQKTAREIAIEMVIANGTAKSHIRHVYKKLGIHSREELFEIFKV
ncbi:MAG: LuxR C-terminal-related transcriptional regulator [Bacteroides sp.]